MSKSRLGFLAAGVLAAGVLAGCVNESQSLTLDDLDCPGGMTVVNDVLVGYYIENDGSEILTVHRFKSGKVIYGKSSSNEMVYPGNITSDVISGESKRHVFCTIEGPKNHQIRPFQGLYSLFKNR